MRAANIIGSVLIAATACTPAGSAATPISVHTQPSAAPLDLTPTAPPTGDLDGRGAWIQTTSMPSRRSEMPALELNGKIYVPGGFGPVQGGLANGYGPVTTFEAFDPATGQWRSLAPMPEPRHHEMISVYKGRLYAFGGFIDPWIAKANAWAYDPATNQWNILKPMPAQRTAGSAVTLGDFIYLVGGTTTQAGKVLPTWRYDPWSDSWTELAPLKQPREHNAAVVLGGKIYALGGRWTTTLSSVEVYDPAADQWTAGPSMHAPRGGFGATVMDDKIYVAGGELIDSLKTLNSAEVFDSATGSWSALPDLPAKLHGVPLVGSGGVLYIIGGSARSADVVNWGRVYGLRP